MAGILRDRFEQKVRQVMLRDEAGMESPIVMRM